MNTDNEKTCRECGISLKEIDALVKEEEANIKAAIAGLKGETFENLCDLGDKLDNLLRRRRNPSSICGDCTFRLENRVLLLYGSKQFQAADALIMLESCCWPLS